MAQPRLMTRREVADYLRTTERNVDRMRQDGRLPAVRFGTRVRFWSNDIDALFSTPPGARKAS
jgi:excisionase family DNA binding protein